MSQDSKPFHMREDDRPPVPRGAYTTDTDPEATFVDIGSIQTDSKTSCVSVILLAHTVETKPSVTDYSEYKSIGKGLSSFARVTEDGRIVISLDLKEKLPDLPPDFGHEVKEFGLDEGGDVPNMNIDIMIVGSRGDVQPYVALGKLLQKDGHRVRIATHAAFDEFVTSAGLEFFCIGGDPKDLMSYMVKNPGLMPGMESLTNGDIGRKRDMLKEMIVGCWLSTYSPDAKTGRSFAADAIISNPPTFAHVHCAEALGIPLLLSFTMPWSPTTSFAHPLVNIGSSNAESGLTNYLSFAIADLLTWQGMGDIVNDFRVKTLGIAPLSLRSGPGIVDRLKIPWTYCMSPALVPKPKDWKSHIDTVGFYFLDLAQGFKPEDDLADFLAVGPPPVYIGFGSVVVEDAAKVTDTIFTATKNAGVRALVSAGWGGLGGVSVPDNVFILGNIPHDWLFKQVSAVVHHGGAGTTAIGLKEACPTLVVPFFGDQPFWGAMIHKAGAGPEPIPHKKLDKDNLTDALKFLISPGAKSAAMKMAERIKHEDGLKAGVESFYKHLPLLNMRCDLEPSKLAIWWSTEHCLKLSAFAAQTLADANLIDMASLDVHHSKEYDTSKPVTDPVTGGAIAIFWTVTHWYTGLVQIIYSPVQGIVKTTVAIPKGVMDIVQSIYKGFHNMPQLYGSEVRKAGKVTDFSSGVKEAGKGLFYGYYDGITGLVTEPYKGGKKDGVVGFVKGAGRSFINATMKPAAGIVGVVAHPFAGAWKGLQNTWARKQESQQRSVRIEDGMEAVRVSSSSDRLRVVAKFKEEGKTTKERQKRYRDFAEEEMYGAKSERKGTGSRTNSNTSAVKSPVGAPSSPPPLPPRKSSSADPPSYVSSPPSVAANVGEEDAAFERELEMAKQLSLAEQRGYERGMVQNQSFSHE